MNLIVIVFIITVLLNIPSNQGCICTIMERWLVIYEGYNIPGNLEVGGRPKLHFPTSKFVEIMDILRHEEPLFITVVPSNGIGTISTSNEPIGEEEND